MKPSLSLPTCPALGPRERDEAELTLPANWDGDPYSLLPDEYVLSAEEADLAERYRNNDISGGYVRSQIAAFRAPAPAEHHDRRKRQFAELKRSVDSSPYALPDSFVRLCIEDSIVNRIRHNNIWLDPMSLLVAVPGIDQCVAVQIFYEGQGCCYFSLLLCDDGDHRVLYHEDEIVVPYPPPIRVSPRLDSVGFFVCSTSFDEWLAFYFLDCKNHDANYNTMLERYPGM